MKMHYRWLVIIAALCCLTIGRPIWAQNAEEADDPSNTAASEAVNESQDQDDTTNAEAQIEDASKSNDQDESESGLRRLGPIVSVGKSVTLRKGEVTDAVVVIGGSAKVDGKVRDAVVAIGGDVEVNGQVGEAVVSVMGDVKAGPEARVNGDVVSVGGSIEKEEGATISGET